MKTILRILLSLFLLILGYECMVDAFHLLNEPSDRAVHAGMAMLVLLCFGLPVVLRYLWRFGHDHLR